MLHTLLCLFNLNSRPGSPLILLSMLFHADGPMQLDDFMSHALIWLLASVVGAVLIGLAFVMLVTKSPR